MASAPIANPQKTKDVAKASARGAGYGQFVREGGVGHDGKS
jgi:hypothetical protein